MPDRGAEDGQADRGHRRNRAHQAEHQPPSIPPAAGAQEREWRRHRRRELDRRRGDHRNVAGGLPGSQDEGDARGEPEHHQRVVVGPSDDVDENQRVQCDERRRGRRRQAA